MLPDGFDISEVDPVIRELVINLNRVPGLYTMTTCEGHVWEDCPAWPTKDGWIHLFRPREMHKGLRLHLNQFLFSHPNFDISENDWTQELVHYTINANMPQHQIDYEQIYGRLSVKLQRDFIDFAKEWKQKVNEGWRDLNDVVVDYIRQNVTEDIGSLPYQQEGTLRDRLTMCRSRGFS